jgi:hypothetical protein
LYEHTLRAYVWARSLLTTLIGATDDRGEGVVSSAIAVLIFAALGALMWVGFKAIWGDASSQTSTQIGKIGS